MLPEVWDCKARKFMDLVDGPWPFISECYANAIPPQGQSALTVATSDSSSHNINSHSCHRPQLLDRLAPNGAG
jgi:hypothetical protein